MRGHNMGDGQIGMATGVSKHDQIMRAIQGKKRHKRAQFWKEFKKTHPAKTGLV